MNHPWSLFALLIVKPFLILALALGLKSTPAPTLQERGPFKQNWTQQLYRHHDEFTRLKLIYSRLPPTPQRPFDPALARIHQLYDTAIQLLEQLETRDPPPQDQLTRSFHGVCLEIQQAQSELSHKLGVPEVKKLLN